MIKTTLCLLLRRDEICLALKKRGFGAGRWNGMGGKVAGGETIRQAAVRELREEVGVAAESKHLIPIGRLKFFFNQKPNWAQEMHIYFLRRWRGEPQETEEMQPRWFPIGAIPFDQMWIDDQHWLPRALRGKKIEGKFYFSNDGTAIEKFDLREKGVLTNA